MQTMKRACERKYEGNRQLETPFPIHNGGFKLFDQTNLL